VSDELCGGKHAGIFAAMHPGDDGHGRSRSVTARVGEWEADIGCARVWLADPRLMELGHGSMLKRRAAWGKAPPCEVAGLAGWRTNH
jgi:hypothetical protein